MSCDTKINLEVNLHDAALIRQYLFQHTKQDSYEFPSERTVDIRNAIVALDEQIQSALDV